MYDSNVINHSTSARVYKQVKIQVKVVLNYREDGREEWGRKKTSSKAEDLHPSTAAL